MRTTYVNNASPAFRFAAFRRDAALGFPPSFVAIFAREPSDATSITQAPFRFSTLFRPCRCIAVRHPCLVATTEGGKRIFKTNERKPRTTKLEPLEWQDTAPRRLLCELRSEAIHRAPTLRTLHNVRAPTRVPTSLRGGNTVLSPRPKPRAAKGAPNSATPFQTSARRSQVVSLVS
jgi:hypothetical protein